MVARTAALTAALFPLASPKFDIMPIMEVGENDDGEKLLGIYIMNWLIINSATKIKKKLNRQNKFYTFLHKTFYN